MRKISFILLTLIFITACSNSRPATKNLDKEEYYILRGINLSQEGKYLEALQEYEKAYAKNSKNPITLRELGLVYGELGNFKKAEDFYKRAVAEDESDQVSYKNLALINYAKGDYDEAKKYLEMVSKDAIDVLTLKLRGFIAAKEGRREEAYPVLKEALLVDEHLDLELYTVYSQVMIDERKFMELYQTLEDSYKKYGNDRSYILFYSSMLSERFGEDQKAVRVLKKYLAENGGGDLLYMQLAKVALSAGNETTAKNSIGMVSDRYKYDVKYLELKREVMKRIGDTEEVERIDKLLKQISQGNNSGVSYTAII